MEYLWFGALWGVVFHGHGRVSDVGHLGCLLDGVEGCVKLCLEIDQGIVVLAVGGDILRGSALQVAQEAPADREKPFMLGWRMARVCGLFGCADCPDGCAFLQFLPEGKLVVFAR